VNWGEEGNRLVVRGKEYEGGERFELTAERGTAGKTNIRVERITLAYKRGNEKGREKQKT